MLVGGVGLIVIGIVIYAFYIGERLNALDEPLLDATREIQLETEAADLWFREFIQGNMVVDLETIWQPLEQSVWYLHTILQSDTGFLDTFFDFFRRIFYVYAKLFQ